MGKIGAISLAHLKGLIQKANARFLPQCLAVLLLASYQIYFFCAGETGSYARLGLPVDPLLGTAYASSIQLYHYHWALTQK